MIPILLKFKNVENISTLITDYFFVNSKFTINNLLFVHI